MRPATSRWWLKFSPKRGVDSAFVWYSVANAAAGALDSLYLKSRSFSDTTVSDPGWAFVEIVKPNLAAGKAVSPNGTQLPGTVLTYTVNITNDGSDDAHPASCCVGQVLNTKHWTGSPPITGGPDTGATS